MADQTPEPTELIYVPQDSAAPIAIAGGLAVALLGLISWIAFTMIGVALVAYGIYLWISTVDSEIAVMRREQEIDTAVIPATPIRRESD